MVRLYGCDGGRAAYVTPVCSITKGHHVRQCFTQCGTPQLPSELERIVIPLLSDASISFEKEDDALANSGAMISNAFEVVRDPEPVGHTLHDARILL
jgi:hypothetical protein